MHVCLSQIKNLGTHTNIELDRFSYTYTHTYIHTYRAGLEIKPHEHNCQIKYSDTYTDIDLNTFSYTYMHTYINTYIHTGWRYKSSHTNTICGNEGLRYRNTMWGNEGLRHRHKHKFK